MTEDTHSPQQSFGIFARLYRWLYAKHLESVLKTVHNNKLLSQKALIDTLETKYPESKEDFRGELAYLVIQKLYESRIPEANINFYEENEELILTEIGNAKNMEEIVKRLNLHHEFMRHYFNDSLHLLSDDYPLKAKLLDPHIKVLSTKEFNKKSKEVSRQLKRVKKEVRAKLKERREKEEYERLPKIEITSPKVSVIFGLFSGLFLCAGFLYNLLFLGYFGIELSKFFTISDYLAASIDKVYYCFISIIVGMAIGLFLYPDYLKGEIPIIRRSKFAQFFDRSVMPFMAVLVVVGYLQKNYHGFFLALQLFLLLLSMHIIIYFLKYFESPIRSYFILVAITWFFLSIFLGVVEDVSSIYRERTEDLKKYHVVFEKGVTLEEKDLILLASNSKYAFFYDKKRQKTIVLPIHDIDRIETKRPSAGGILIPMIVDRFRGNGLNH
jgi:hypothetical protein